MAFGINNTLQNFVSGLPQGYNTSVGNIPNERFVSNFAYDTGLPIEQLLPQMLNQEQLYGENFNFLQGQLKDTIGGKLDPALMQILNAGRRDISGLGDVARRETDERLASSGFRGAGANLVNNIFNTQTNAYEDLNANVAGLGMQARQQAIAQLLGLNQFQANQNVGQEQYRLSGISNLANLAMNRANTKRQMDIGEMQSKVGFEDVLGGILGTAVGGFAGGFGGAYGNSLFKQG